MQTSMFKNPAEEQEMYQALKALVEEWGHEHITIHFPTAWGGRGYNLGGLVKCFFDTTSYIDITVKYENVGYIWEHTAKRVELNDQAQ